jgi:hypothetical protein
MEEKNGQIAHRTIVVGRLFADEAVQYIHVRSTKAGCFLFRLQRA